MSWYQEFNSSFWLSITGLFIGSIATCFAYCYKSKCSHIKLCGGLIDVMRDIEAELEDVANDIPAPTNPTTNPSPVVEEPKRRASIRKSLSIQQAVDSAVKHVQSSNLNLQTLDERLRQSKEHLETTLSQNAIDELNRKDSLCI
jgi:hypothetical protein